MSDYFTDDAVLFNKLGIEDENELKKAEEEIVAARMVEVIEKPMNGSFDFTMLKKIHEKLKQQDYLINLPKDDFIREFAELTEELNALHPFREGNGRAMRIFLKQLAENAGWYIAYEDMDAKELLEADIKSFEGDPAQLMELIEKHIIEYM